MVASVTLGALGMDQGPKRVAWTWWEREHWWERGAMGMEGTRARALCRVSFSLSRMSLCSWTEFSASRADISSFLSLETFSSSCSTRL